MSQVFKRVLQFGFVGAVGATSYVLYNPELTRPSFHTTAVPALVRAVPTRKDAIEELQRIGTLPESPIDLFVIGGGSVGSGVALDAVTRGLRVAMVDRADYASGTSSRSTKLIHGGVRYLEYAATHLSKEHYHLLAEALAERAIMIHQAPHLARPIETIIPCYSGFDVAQYWVGLKLYDLIAALHKGTLSNSSFVDPIVLMNRYPKLLCEKKSTREVLLGGVAYYDGQMDDARVNLSAALTAAAYGATVANYVTVTGLETVTNSQGAQVVKVSLQNRIPTTTATAKNSDKVFHVYSKAVVNACGPLSDAMRDLTGDQRGASLVPSVGSHMILPAPYCMEKSGMLIPTSDDRVMFAIPWLGSCLVGTTDEKTAPQTSASPPPRATIKEVTWMKKELENVMGPIPNEDIKSVWCGIRPLAARLPPAPKTSEEAQEMLRKKALEAASGTPAKPISTKDAAREHIVDVDLMHRMVSLTGGKWTTYRKIGEDVVDTVLRQLLPEVPFKASLTKDLQLIGAHEYDKVVAAAQEGSSSSAATSSSSSSGASVWTALNSSHPAVVKRWLSAYGDQAPALAAMVFGGAEVPNRALSKKEKDAQAALLAPLVPSRPEFVKAEVLYSVQREHTATIEDFLARRTRLAFLDVATAMQSVEPVSRVMAEALGWNESTRKERVEQAQAHLRQCFTVGGN